MERALGFFHSRPNWDPPTPHPQASAPPPFVSGVGGTHSLTGEGVGGRGFQLERDIPCGALGKYVRYFVACLLQGRYRVLFSTR
jgi:hypothetical protein